MIYFEDIAKLLHRLGRYLGSKPHVRFRDDFRERLRALHRVVARDLGLDPVKATSLPPKTCLPPTSQRAAQDLLSWHNATRPPQVPEYTTQNSS